MFWPTDLAAIYPHPASRYYLRDQWPGWEVCTAALLLLAVSALCLLQARRRPHLAVGWFWYLGMMVPVIGLVQAGDQAMADRYTYLPLIGPVLGLVWLLFELARFPSEVVRLKARERLGARQSSGSFELRNDPPDYQRTGARKNLAENRTVFTQHSKSALHWAYAALTLLALSACAVLTRGQLHYWRDTAALFEHTVDVTADNPDAQFAWGVGLEKGGLLGRAMVCYRAATAICPAYAEAHYNLGQLLRKRGAWREAIQEYLAAIHTNPRCLPAYLNLAGILVASGQTRQAVEQFGEALRIEPDSTEALNNLAWIMAANSDPAVRNGARAVEYAERACQLTQFKQTTIVGTLAAAYAEAGRFADAAATAEKACALAAQNGEQGLLEKNRQLLELYRAGKPYHEPGR
jgi:tetratricopeptide (TPR) repeat protein